jgi:MtN3 and saliva related transmembrane protein
MPVKIVTVVSLFAATLSMVSYIPQAWTIIRSRSTEGVSLRMYVITVAGFCAWLFYGVLVRQWAIIVQNLICLALSCFILVMKLLPPRKTAAVADALAPALGIDEPGDRPEP